MTPCKHQWEELDDGSAKCRVCERAPTFSVQGKKGERVVMYVAQPHQMLYHESAVPNLLMLGPRGTGKSLCMRMDAHMRALAVSGFTYLVLRRTMPELKKTHLKFIAGEMDKIGGNYHHGDSQARYPNGSLGFYGHCDSEADTMKSLGGEYDLVIVDEITTFPGDLILRIMACVRVPEGSGRVGMLRAGTNPMGMGAEFVKKYFVDKAVPVEENEDYNPDDYATLHTLLSDNPYVDAVQYQARLKALPAHVRKAWLDGEWSMEGAYFNDFRPTKDGKPWHVIPDIPQAIHEGRHTPIIEMPYTAIYRCIDWGYHPDPAVCLWIAVLPNKRAVVFKERTWHSTLAAEVAKAIVQESQGMRVIETFCDPTMLIETGSSPFTIGGIFEQNKVPLSPSTNARDLAGYAVNEYLAAEIDGLPRLQIVGGSGYYGCPKLIQTFPTLQQGKPDPNKIADGNDHWVIALAYFCMGAAASPVSSVLNVTPKWMKPKPRSLYERRL